MQPKKSSEIRIRVFHHFEVGSVNGHTGPSQLVSFH
jgi:hypothetical protein